LTSYAPAWGLMLQGGAEEYASTAPWIAIFPGLAIALTVFGFSLSPRPLVLII
jgi:peptide/nickel transport system permease protein